MYFVAKSSCRSVRRFSPFFSPISSRHLCEGGCMYGMVFLKIVPPSIWNQKVARVEGEFNLALFLQLLIIEFSSFPACFSVPLDFRSLFLANDIHLFTFFTVFLVDCLSLVLFRKQSIHYKATANSETLLQKHCAKCFRNNVFLVCASGKHLLRNRNVSEMLDRNQYFVCLQTAKHSGQHCFRNMVNQCFPQQC